VRLLRRALLALAVTAIALVLLAEVAGRVVVERVAAEELRDAGVAREVEVVVGDAWWKPSVVPALLGADLDRVTVRMVDARMHPLTVARADYVLEGLDVELSLRSRSLAVTGLRQGAAAVLVDPQVMGEQLGFSATVEGDRLLVGPELRPAEVRAEGNELVVTSDAFAEDGGSVRLPVIDSYVLPCEPRVRVRAGKVTLYCTTTELPGMLRQHLGPPVEVDPDLPPPPVELEPPVTAEMEPDSSDGPEGSTTSSTTTSAPAQPGG
jgi:hypothetical protein